MSTDAPALRIQTSANTHFASLGYFSRAVFLQDCHVALLTTRIFWYIGGAAVVSKTYLTAHLFIQVIF